MNMTMSTKSGTFNNRFLWFIESIVGHFRTVQRQVSKTFPSLFNLSVLFSKIKQGFPFFLLLSIVENLSALSMSVKILVRVFNEKVLRFQDMKNSLTILDRHL